ncbi:MAG: S41 family peptidase [Gammaproteobacteria bacterium]|nr:MAG: S41 family peptidase [Gammaproteobacteria bacterium]
MTMRPLILAIFTSLLILTFNPPSFAQTTNTQGANDEDISRFTNSIVLIKDFYVQPVGDKTLLDDAIRGMVNGLDPHSEYLDKEAYKTLLMTTSGEFGGVGIEIMPEYGILKIVTPIDDTPAAKAGIKAGDYIVALDGKLVSEMSLQEAVDKMRGKPGSPLTMTILRKGEKLPLSFKLIRQTIRIASVKSKMLDGNFGYIRITQFQEPTAKLMRDAILALKNQNGGNLKGIILDLRNNPGGLLESAVQVVNTFLDSKKLENKFGDRIVYTEGRLPESQYAAKATGADIMGGAPIVVLINSGSASASEIVAGALQDYRRALIVGTTSFGKGSVQTVIPLDKTHALKLTTALYHTPSGRVIQNIGIIPDVRVEDLKVVKNKSDEDLAMIEPIKEYQLKNHLKGTSSGMDSNDNNKSGLEQIDIVMAGDDFQLFEALKILRTMYAMNEENWVTKK